MPAWTYEQIAALSPDTAVLSKGRGISFARQRWKLLEGNESLIWGEYEGGGDRLYRMAAMPGESRFACSCKAPIPCKHVIGLLFLLQRDNELFRITGDVPGWVNTAFQTAGEKRRKTAEEVVFKSDPKRLEQMREGLVFLEEWLNNLIKQGFAAFAQPGDRAWETIASRMVDAKLGGVARRLRLLGARPRNDQWHAHMLGEVADLYLLCKAFQRLEELPEHLQRDALTAGGVNVKKEEVWAQPEVSGQWLVAGQQTGIEESLHFRRTWLLAEGAGRIALLLDFAWGNPPVYETRWVTGGVIAGQLSFYPGSYPLRAVVKRFEWSSKPYETPEGCADWAAFQKKLAVALSANPWLNIFPAYLTDVIPVFKAGKLCLVDSNGQSAQVLTGPQGPWPLLAMSGGHPIRVFGEWEDALFRPISVFQDGRVVGIN